MFDDYKKNYTGNYLEEFLKKATPFENAVGEEFLKLNAITNYGITPESLVALRARFILHWYPVKAKKYTYKLFDLQRTLMQEGFFTASNY